MVREGSIFRQLTSGVLLGLLFAGILVGSVLLAFAEDGFMLQPAPTDTVAFLPGATQLVLPPVEDASTEMPMIASNTPVPTETLTPPITCPPPTGWVAVLIRQGDTLEKLARHYKTTPQHIMSANCLLSSSLPPAGYVIYLPPQPTATNIPCGPPSGWVRGYTVHSGDNLYRISRLYRTTVRQLQNANCLKSITIYEGMKLWVPNVPTSTPTFTPTSIATQTATPPTVVASHTATASATPTNTATQTPSATPTTSPTPPATASPTH